MFLVWTSRPEEALKLTRDLSKVDVVSFIDVILWFRFARRELTTEVGRYGTDT